MYSNSVTEWTVHSTVHSTVYEDSTWIQSCQFGSWYLATACRRDDAHREKSYTRVLDSKGERTSSSPCDRNIDSAYLSHLVFEKIFVVE